MSDDESVNDARPDSPRHDVVETAVGALRALLGTEPEDDDRSSGSADSVWENSSSDEKSE